MFSFTIRPRVLIVQPGKDIDGHIGKLLAEKNCQVEETDGLDTGARIIKTLSFDAVILDLDPSYEDHFSQFIREYETGPPLILISDSSQKLVNEKRLGYPIYDCLVRPVSDLDISKIAQELTDRKLLLEENRLLKERLKALEKHTNRLFTELEDKVMRNTREIAEKKEVLQKIFNRTDGEIILVDKNNHIIQTNNHTVGQPIEMTSDQITDEKPIMAADLQNDSEDWPGYRAMKTGKTISIEKTAAEGKDRIIRQTAFPVFDSNMEEIWGFVQFNQDVTEERIEQDRLIQLEKIKVIEKLATFFSCNLQTLPVVAHDMINKLAKRLKKKDAELKDFLQLLDHQVIRAEDYMADLFYVLNQGPDGAALINVNDLLQVILSQNKQAKTTPERINVVFEPVKGIPPLVRVNRSQLARVFAHLIDNAFDSMQTGGELKVVTRKKDSEKDSEVEIEFSDTGTGIPEEIRDKIFEPFFTTKAKRLGLGLYVCKSILEKYYGRLILRHNQTPDRPTSFIVNIPVSRLDCHACKR
ncbi:MAG: hybrid sensor histidine kinase/response regulator [bacterium]